MSGTKDEQGRNGGIGWKVIATAAVSVAWALVMLGIIWNHEETQTLSEKVSSLEVKVGTLGTLIDERTGSRERSTSEPKRFMTPRAAQAQQEANP
jgi:hypothetical protein